MRSPWFFPPTKLRQKPLRFSVRRVNPSSRSHSAVSPLNARVRVTSRTLGAALVSASVAGVASLSTPAAAQVPYGAPPTGQLLPPPPPPTPEAINTQQELELSERVDSGRGLQFFWVAPEAAMRWYDWGLLSESNLLDEQDFESQGFAPTFGLGAGLRFLYITGGARFRVSIGDLPFWTAGLEAALRIPMGDWEPYALVGGGYLRTLEYADKCGGCYKDLVVSGGYAALGGGIDYFVTPAFSVGPRLDVEIPFVGRSALPETDEGVFAEDGSGVGLSANLGLHLGLHF